MRGRHRSLGTVRGLAALSVAFTHWVRVRDGWRAVIPVLVGTGLAVSQLAGLELYWCAPFAIAVVALLAYRFVEHPKHEFGRRGRSRIQLVPETEKAAGVSPSAASSM